MGSISETLLPIFVVIAIVVFNFLRPRLARWLQEQERAVRESRAREREGTVIDAPVPPRDPGHPPASDIAALHTPRTREAAAAAPRRSAIARSYLANRSTLRQAIVVATVLGPCRAEKPQDDRW